MPRRARVELGCCWICEQPIAAPPYVEQVDAVGRLVMHFGCFTRGTAVRLQGCPPSQQAADAYNATIKTMQVHV
jgi:hypothetical protein